MTNAETPEVGTFWYYPPMRVFARVDEHVVNAGLKTVLFSVWDPKQPGWQKGAGLPRSTFREMYNTEVTAETVRNTKPLVEITITATHTIKVDPNSDMVKRAYKTDNPQEIYQIDRDNAWDILYDAMTGSDEVAISTKMELK